MIGVPMSPAPITAKDLYVVIVCETGGLVDRGHCFYTRSLRL
jgi:hypothetical protein